ncbi:ATP-binding protein [Enterovibrio calviensis]|uniref:ATP-binding protein n=1 Tax=Enterovibrio calviensis TaxID=91359 RepID=UPI00048196EF|nr:ATP-binding protein [Enterovibrio calviensis]
MFKIKYIKISGFWGEHTLESEFNNSVNVIIGRNGTGKTTFMSILHAVLTVDIEWLYDFEFKEVEIKLSEGKKTKTIKVKKIISNDFRFPHVEYVISNNKYSLRVVGSDENVPSHFKRRILEESEEIRNKMDELVNITTLSVYRIKKDYEQSRGERQESKNISPVDLILQDLVQRLTTYQLELSDRARVVSSTLQRKVLTSLLYTGDSDHKSGFTLDFDKKDEKRKLITAYKQLGVLDSKVKNDINKHVEKVDESIGKMKHVIENAYDNEALDFNFISPLERIKQTNKVVNMSLEAEKEEKEIFKQRDDFLKILKAFITDKDFEFQNGNLTVKKNGGVPVSKLSSGEKQLIILFAEALLQRQEPYIFIADEPELSLHVAWQREILPAIKKLNPNAQLIVATHSPEVAGKYSDRLIDMEDLHK